MPRGRKPKPTALRILEGKPGHRPLNLREPQPLRGIPPRPECLDEIARQEWARVTVELDRLGLLTQVDMAPLASYCQAFSRWYQAEEWIKRKRMVFTTPNGFLQKRPEVTIAHEAMRLMHRFAVEFGLTPSARTRLSVEGRNKDDGKGKAERFFS